MRMRRLALTTIGGLAVLTVAASVTVFVPAARRYLRESAAIERLQSEDRKTRRLAAEELAAMRSVRAIPTLLELFERPGAERYLTTTLVGIGRRGIPALLRGLEHRDDTVRCAAAYVLGELRAEQAVGALANQFRHDSTTRGRVYAGEALAKLGPGAVSALPAVIEGLADRRRVIRSVAAAIATTIGPPAREAGPALVRLLTENHPDIRRAATAALLSVGYEPED